MSGLVLPFRATSGQAALMQTHQSPDSLKSGECYPCVELPRDDKLLRALRRLVLSGRVVLSYRETLSYERATRYELA